MAKKDTSILILADFPNLGIKRGDNLREALTRLDNQLTPNASPIDFIVGDGEANTPASATDSYINSQLIGKRFYIIQNGLGKLHLGVHYSVNTDGDGFVLNGGATFNNGEQYSIIFFN